MFCREPVVDHRRDQRPVLVDLGLGLDQRRDLDDVVRRVALRRRRSRARASSACSSNVADHRLQDVDLVLGVGDLVGVGPQQAFEVGDALGLELRTHRVVAASPSRNGSLRPARELADPCRDLLEPAGRAGPRARRSRCAGPSSSAATASLTPMSLVQLVGAGLERAVAVEPRVDVEHERRADHAVGPASSSPMRGTPQPRRRRTCRPSPGSPWPSSCQQNQPTPEPSTSSGTSTTTMTTSVTRPPARGAVRRPGAGLDRVGFDVGHRVARASIVAGRRFQPRLEHHRGRDLVDDLRAVVARVMPASPSAAFGGDGREALVVRDDLDVGPPRRTQLLDLARAACAAGPVPPDSDSGSPTTIVVTASASRAARRSRGGRRRGRGPRASTECGDATVRVGSESASPMRTDPRSTPSTRPAARRDAVSSFTAATQPPARGRVASASSMPSTFGPPPTTASAPLPTPPPSALAAGRRDRVGRRAPLDEVLAHRDRDRRPCRRAGAGERDDARARAPAPSPARAGAARRCRARRGARRPRRRSRLRARSAAAASASLALSRCSSSWSARTCSTSRSIFSGTSFGRGAQQLAGAAQQLLFLLDVLERAVAGHRLDAPQVRADRAFAHDLDRADEAERVHVRAAAQLGRRARLRARARSSPYFSPKNAIAPMPLGFGLASSRSGAPARR